MNQQELETEISRILESDGDYHSDLTIKVEHRDPGYWCITVEQMYEFIQVTYDFLTELSKLFETREIDVGSQFSSGGCETCDYGSSYRVEIHIRNAKLTLDGP